MARWAYMPTITTTVLVLLMSVGCSEKTLEAKPVLVYLVLGSTRQGRTSEKIAQELKSMVKRSDVKLETVDLRDYPLPFLNDEIAPASRKEITDPAVQKWSEKIKQADAFVFIVPEYNAGYPGVLKNALDSLYPEWNNKPVALVGYSGGTSGGASALGQLKQVVSNLQMKSITSDLLIPQVWKAFDEFGHLVAQDASKVFNTMINELTAAVSKA